MKAKEDTATKKRLTNRQKDMLKALDAAVGNVKVACQAIKISRTTHYTWLDTSDTYKKEYDDVKEGIKDWGESLLHKRMADHDTTAIIFFNKTQNKDRGYIERAEVTGRDGGSIDIGRTVDFASMDEADLEALASIGKKLLSHKEE